MPQHAPGREPSRLAALRELLVLDTPEETAFDELVRTAADLCDAPIALISLIDEHRQWFKARVGLQVKETPREHAFCAHAIATPNETMQVADATQDERFASNPLVTGEPGIRFYAGAPLVTSDGQPIGTLCVIDRVPRQLDPQKLEMLRFLAQQVVTRLEERRRGSAESPLPSA